MYIMEGLRQQSYVVNPNSAVEIFVPMELSSLASLTGISERSLAWSNPYPEMEETVKKMLRDAADYADALEEQNISLSHPSYGNLSGVHFDIPGGSWRMNALEATPEFTNDEIPLKITISRDNYGEDIFCELYYDISWDKPYLIRLPDENSTYYYMQGFSYSNNINDVDRANAALEAGAWLFKNYRNSNAGRLDASEFLRLLRG